MRASIKRSILFIVCGLLLAALIFTIVYAAWTAGGSNLYKRDAQYVFLYAQSYDNMVASYGGVQVHISPKNMVSLYEQLTSGLPRRVFRHGKATPEAIALDVQDDQVGITVYPTGDDEEILVDFLYEGKSRRFVVTGSTSFSLICRIVSLKGFMYPNSLPEG